MKTLFEDEIMENFHSILNTMDEGIYITDADGKTLFVNQAYEQLTGLSNSFLCGKTVYELVDMGIFNKILNPEIVKTSRKAISVQELGDNKKVILRGFPIFKNNKVCLVITFVRDITSMVQLTEQVEQQRRLIDDYQERMLFMAQEHAHIKDMDKVFVSPTMQKLLCILRKISSTDATTLLLGETGVGKDVLARLIHDLSTRKDKMFLKVDCGSIADTLIESELFGYIPGAFSGASSKGKPGYFEMADGGTVMLDEIGELPLPMQAKLLRVLQDQEIMRVGSSTAKKVDVRIVAATNKNLEESMKNGQFRSDLYYRLNVAVLNIPSLRDRVKDIRPLVEYFLKKFALKYKHKVTFAESTLKILESYHWPGNVRELQNLIHSLIITRDQPVILPADLPPHIAGYSKNTCSLSCPIEARPLKEIMADVEKELLINALNALGSVNEVAKMFSIDRTTVFRKTRGKNS